MQRSVIQRTARAVAFACLALAATACSAGQSQGRPDACALIGADAAGKVLGTRVTVKPQDTSLAGPDAASMCHYLTGSARGSFTLLAARIPYKNGDAAAELADRKKQILSDWNSGSSGLAKPTFTDVDGLGEAATLLKAQGFFELHVLAHGAVVVITMTRAANAETVAQAEKLARIALGKLE